MDTRSALATLAITLGLSATFASAQAPPAGQAPGAGQAPAAGQTPAAGAAPARGGRGGNNGNAPDSCGPNPPPEVKNAAKDSRCFELRTYTLRPGGVGDIDLLHARFRQHSIRLLTKAGMTVVGIWQPVAKPDTIVYLVAYKDAAARNAAWTAFNADPEWVKVRTEMNVGISVEQTFMVATDYGMLK
jgi:NIPSNAP